MAATAVSDTNIVAVDFRPVVVDFAEASTPKGEIAQRLAAEAAEQALKLSEASSKKEGTLRMLSTGRGDLFSVNPYLLKIKNGWNSREMNDPANIEHIDTLARSIAAVGVQQPLTVMLEDDQIFVSDGHCRLFATLRAVEVYGAEIKSVPVRAEGRFATEADRVLSQIVRNSGKPLTVLEQGAVFVKLTNYGWSVAQIAEKAGLTVVRVGQILDLMAGASDAIKALVASGSVSASEAQKIMREDGGDVKAAEKTIKDALDLARAEGKKRATAKHVARARGKSPSEAKAARKAGMVRLAEIFSSADITVSRTGVSIDHLSNAEWLEVKQILNFA
jgi:ParB-like chromosome segregation protein Spo0J